MTHHGTGFLATPDLVITNRHVAQIIAPLVSAQGVVYCMYFTSQR